MNHNHYFVSYAYPTGYGNVQLAIDHDRFDMDSIRFMQDHIREKYKEDALIINIIQIGCDCDKDQTCENS